MSSQIRSKIFRDNYFLNIAKLFDQTKDKKIKSIPKLIESLIKNEHLFNIKEREYLNMAILTFEANLKESEYIIKLIIDHRHQCLAHPDTTTECLHLNEIDSIQTGNILNLVITYLDEIAVIFNTEKFNIQNVEQIKDKMGSNFYNIIKKMES